MILPESRETPRGIYVDTTQIYRCDLRNLSCESSEKYPDDIGMYRKGAIFTAPPKKDAGT